MSRQHSEAQEALCGHMKIEEAHKFEKQRYFLLDLTDQCLRIYLDDPRNLPKTAHLSDVCEEIDLNCISKVSDARKLRPKGGFCFYITHSGDQIFIQANTQEEMHLWINRLNDACRIVVKDVPHMGNHNLAPANSRNEVAGGVLITTPPENSDSGAESLEQNMPALSLPSFKSGYATKQGALRKNWKRRYFVLDHHGLSYYKHDQEKDPIKTIPLEQILKARGVERQHHPHREHMFEVITDDRTFFVQCELRQDCQEWVELINERAESSHLPTDTMDNSAVNPKSKSLPRPSSQEATKPSKAVWGGDLLKHPDDAARESRLNIRRSKKSWQLW